MQAPFVAKRFHLHSDILSVTLGVRCFFHGAAQAPSIIINKYFFMVLHKRHQSMISICAKLFTCGAAFF